MTTSEALRPPAQPETTTPPAMKCAFAGCTALYDPPAAGRHNEIDGSVSTGWFYPPPRYAADPVTASHTHRLRYGDFVRAAMLMQASPRGGRPEGA